MDHVKCHKNLIKGIWKDVLDLEAARWAEDLEIDVVATQKITKEL